MSLKFQAPVPSGGVRITGQRVSPSCRKRQTSLDILNYHMIVSLSSRERGWIQVPQPLKARLDGLRREGTTASGLMRHLLAEHFKRAAAISRKGR